MILRLQLTPSGRKSNIFISLQAKNATYVSFETDNKDIAPVMVIFAFIDLRKIV